MEFFIKMIGIVIGSISLLNIQLRIVDTIFPQQQERRKIIQYTLLMGFLVASSLLVFTYIIQPYLKDYTWSRLYSLFIIIIGGGLSLIFAHKRDRRGTFIISTMTIIAVITGTVEFLFAGAGIGLLLLKATGEEILKTASSQSLSTHSIQYKSDVIIYSVLAGLGFALFENIIYFISSWSRWQFLARSLTTSFLHGIFTWCIGYVLWRQSKIWFMSYILAYSFWITLHALYNIALVYYPVVGGLTFTIGWYFLLTYLLFKSDRLYSNNHA